MRFTTVMIAAFALLAVGCKKKDAAPAATTPPAVAPTPAPPVASIGVLELGRHVGTNRRVTDTTSVFAPRDTFYLAVVSENTAPGAMLLAKWSFQTGQTVDSTTQAVAAPAAGEPVSVTGFHLSKASAWPAGKYRVEVWLDGASKGSREFEVKR